MRCKGPNLCRYCRKLATIEIAEVLQNDAAETGGPTVWVVLTAREHLTRAQCTPLLKELRKAARRAGWPEVAWFVQVEFQKRGALHLNLLVKGVPARDAERFLEVLTEAWCRLVDARPQGQWCEAIGEGVAVARYVTKLLAHGLKESQAPRLGWKGHRTSQTTGRHAYFPRPMPEMREEAKRSLRVKRERWKRTQRLREREQEAGVDLPPEAWGELLEGIYAAAGRAAAHAETVSWQLIRLPA